MRWSALSLLLVGCTQSLSIEGYCAEFPRAQCRAGQRCGGVSAAVHCDDVPPVSPTCADVFERTMVALQLRFDGVAAKACVDATLRAECIGQYPVPAACTDVLVGGADAGAPCGVCGGGLFCAAQPNQLCGTCVPPTTLATTPIGSGCTFTDNRCGPDAFCKGDVCTARPGVGEGCSSNECALGLRCVANVCATPGELSDACDPSLGCKGGLWCDNGRCALTRPLGEACSAPIACQSVRCVDGACAGPSGEGEACRSGCDVLLTCVNDVCVRGAGLGEACGVAGCVPGGRCVDGVCGDVLSCG